MMRYSVAKCQRKERIAIAFLYKILKIIEKKKSAFPMLYKGGAMNNILDKFSLSLILRQFFCGIVFFIPCLLASSHGCSVLDKISGLSSVPLIFIAVISLIIGTIIYHIEKNTYSYFIQGLLLLFLRIINNKENNFFAVAVVIAIALGVSYLLWSLVAYTSLVVIVGILAIALIICFSDIASFYQNVWSIEKPKNTNTNTKLIVSECRVYMNKKEQGFEDKVETKPYLILGHLDTWSDNIHCVQCCCFSWLLGIVFANWTVSHNYVCCSCQCWTDGEIIHESICAALKSPDCLCVYVLLILEIFFEFHRFYHLYKITEG